MNLIDEPTKGLAPGHRRRHGRGVARPEGRGRHDPAGRAELSPSPARWAAPCAVIEDGRIDLAGAMAELAGDTALQERLMGLSLEAP